MTVCPIQCLTINAEGFIQKNESFILTCVASFSALIGVLLSYCIRSRCSQIKCCGVSCIRQPLEDVTIADSS